MATINLGKVKVTPEGLYDFSKSYAELSLVGYEGSSYISIKDVPAGTLPTNTSYWQLHGSKGADGANGADGNDGIDAYQPFKGWYDASTSLSTAFPTPQVGDYAYVAGSTSSDPVTIYRCTTAGTWAASSSTFNPANNQEFASGQSLNTVNIVDNLTSSSATDVLSAKQGKELKGQIDALGPKISRVAVKDEEGEIQDSPFKIVSNPEFIAAVLDSNDKFIFGVRTNGEFEWAIGVPAVVKEFIAASISEKVDKETGKGLSTNDFTTLLKSKLEAIDMSLKVDKEEGKSLISSDYANGVSTEQNPEWIEVHRDSNGRILYGVRKDGSFDFIVGIPSSLAPILDKIPQLIYCSSENGDDNNDGMSPSNAVKTISKAISLGSNILLERGSVFYETALILQDKNVGAYGGGSKPKVCGFVNYKTANGFVQVNGRENVWSLDLSLCAKTGLPSSFGYNPLSPGFIYVKDKNKIVWGHLCLFFTEAEMNERAGNTSAHTLTYIHSEGDFYMDANGLLYVYYSGNPNEDFGEISISYNTTAIRLYGHCEVRDIHIEGHNYGITRGGESNGIIIEDVDIDLIGGIASSGSVVGGTTLVRAGNGIELWANGASINKDIVVRKCKISRVFDCGITIQGNLTISQDSSYIVRNGNEIDYAATALAFLDSNPFSSSNITIECNDIFNCRQAYEAFSHFYVIDKTHSFEWPLNKCIYQYNKSWAVKDNGFNSPEIRDSHLLSSATDMRIIRNTFIGGNFWYSHYNTLPNQMFFSENVVYIEEGSEIYGEYNNHISMPISSNQETWFGKSTFEEAVNEAIRLYRLRGNDNTTKFVLCSTLDINLISHI